MNQSAKTRDLARVAVLSAVIIILASTPLGFIPLGFMNATTIHIPVIIGSILLGPKKGAFLGGIFGLSSLVKATVAPNATSFVFSPFYSAGDLHGNFWSLIICLVPRILTGIVPYFVYRFLKRACKGNTAALAGAGFCGSMTNTLLVMNLIYLFFGRQYAQATEHLFSGLYTVILGVICINGIPEALIACFLTAAIVKALAHLPAGRPL